MKNQNNKNTNNKNTNNNSNSKVSFDNIGAIVGIFVGFLTGSYIFYGVGKDNLSNKCEGEKIYFTKVIDSLKRENLRIYDSIKLLEIELVELYIMKDSLNKIIDNQNLKIKGFKKDHLAQIHQLINEGEALLLNNELIDAWRKNCITFLTINNYMLLEEYKKKTDYTLSATGQRKGAIEDGITILKTIK